MLHVFGAVASAMAGRTIGHFVGRWRERKHAARSSGGGSGDRDARQADETPPQAAHADCYAILGLEPGASVEQIKAAHRKLALELHPDRLPRDASDAVRDLVKAKMQAVNVARDVLLADAEARFRRPM